MPNKQQLELHMEVLRLRESEAATLERCTQLEEETKQLRHRGRAKDDPVAEEADGDNVESLRKCIVNLKRELETALSPRKKKRQKKLSLAQLLELVNEEGFRVEGKLVPREDAPGVSDV